MKAAVQTYYANGKLLLSGEYFVLHGAKALALPLKTGQQLTVRETSEVTYLHWKALYGKNTWFECNMGPVDFEVLHTTDQEKAATLSCIFHTIRQFNPAFQPVPGTHFETCLNADPAWGFGSSSTLISLLSQWASVDPFLLNERIFKGSGFDIACATAHRPILYQKHRPVKPIRLDYPFAPQLWLVYSGNKKSTFPEVRAFLKNNKISSQQINEISAISEAFARCRDQQTFHQLIRRHETMVGELIGHIPVKESLFHDFPGEVKSLGAWGGDYYLFSSGMPERDTKKYFENKGLNIIFRWAELIKT